MNFREILTSARTIAIIGCSADPDRTSFGIARQLQRKGYHIIPVNPNYEEILGEKCYDRITSIPVDIQIDIAVIFRNKTYTRQMVETINERAGQTGKKPVIWTQPGVSLPAAEKLALDEGFTYIKNHCIAVEYAKHMG